MNKKLATPTTVLTNGRVRFDGREVVKVPTHGIPQGKTTTVMAADYEDGQRLRRQRTEAHETRQRCVAAVTDRSAWEKREVRCGERALERREKEGNRLGKYWNYVGACFWYPHRGLSTSPATANISYGGHRRMPAGPKPTYVKYSFCKYPERKNTLAHSYLNLKLFPRVIWAIGSPVLKLYNFWSCFAIFTALIEFPTSKKEIKLWPC